MKYKIILLTAAVVLAQSTIAATIETDHTWYLAGEAMTVSITDDDALIAYAELCDVNGLAAGAVVSLQGSKGKGVIELPSDLHSGYYVLSAYTRHSTHVSQRLVAVVNPLRKSADDDIEWVAVTNPDSVSWNVEGGRWNETPQKSIDLRETEGHIIKARVKNTYNGHTFKASQIHPSIAIVGKQIHYFEGKMTDDSTAVFFTFGVHGRQPLVLSAMSSTGVSLPIEMISPFAALLPKSLPHLVFHYNRSEVETRSLNMQRHQIAIAPAKRELKLGDYADDKAVESVPLDYDETVFGTKPDLTYNLDEYRQFFKIKEVLLEYVSCVKTTTIDDVTQLIVRRDSDPYDSSWPAMVLIDGMPVINIERLLNYDARRIHYINIYGGQYTFGNGVYNGILSFITRSGRLTNYPTEPNVQYLVYEFPE
jgi:hypothetical protein